MVADSKGIDILVVDDEAKMRHILRLILEEAGHSVREAQNGREALEVARDILPDCLLLDIVMPDMDGWQVLDAMARDEAIPHVPTFFVSARDPADDPPVSRVLMVTMDEGLPLDKLLRCSLGMSALLLQP